MGISVQRTDKCVKVNESVTLGGVVFDDVSIHQLLIMRGKEAYGRSVTQTCYP